MELSKIQNTQDDNWSSLKDFTQARIALGRTGVAIPLKETLQFRLAHAHARDAVYSSLDLEKLHTGISELGLDYMDVQSEVQSRDEYLKRPDKGRELGEQSRLQLQQLTFNPCDICIVLSDGLSAMAINENAIPLIQILSQLSKKMHYSLAPIILVDQGRVAVADEIAAILQASIVIHLIGERPGLSSSNSLGAYITYHPQKGLTDETRNCISNIRPEGLQIPMAAEKIMYLVRESLRMGLSGVQLKDTFPGHLLLD